MTQDCQRTLRNPPLQHHQGVPLYFFKQVELKKQKQNQKQTTLELSKVEGIYLEKFLFLQGLPNISYLKSA